MALHPHILVCSDVNHHPANPSVVRQRPIGLELTVIERGRWYLVTSGTLNTDAPVPTRLLNVEVSVPTLR